MDYTRNHDLAHSLILLEKYFHIHQKSEVLTSVNNALRSLENSFTIARKDQDATRYTCRRLVKKPRSKFSEWAEPITQIYYLNQSGEITRDDDEDDPSQLVLILKSGSIIAEPKFASNPAASVFKLIKLLKEYRSFSNILGFIPGEFTVSKQVRESIQAVITASSKRFNHVFLICKIFLGRKLKLKLGIGKGIEGYIPFITWARGSLLTQLVNNLVFIDKLSQFKLRYGDN